MKLIIVRHGQSFGDIDEVHEGRADLELTDLGEEQAYKLSKWLKGREEIDIIISSPLKRARKTAEYIGSEIKKELRIDEHLMEWNNGLLAGVKRDVANMDFPIPDGGRKPHHEHYQTESEIDFRARAEMFLSKLKEDHNDGETICIVSHGGMINMLLKSLLELPMNTGHSFSSGDTAVHSIAIYKSGCELSYLNSLVHLKEDA